MQNRFLLRNLANKALATDTVDLIGFAPLTNGTTRITVCSNQATTPTTHRYAPNTFLAGVSLEVISSSVSDTSTGVGARTVQIAGVLSSGARSTVTVTMNGTVAVAVPGTWIGVNDFRVLTTGTIGIPNAGDITLRIAGAGARTAIITATFGMATLGVYTVPAGRYLYLNHYTAKQYAAAVAITPRLFLSQYSIARPLWDTKLLVPPNLNTDYTLALGIVVPPLTTIEWSTQLTTGTTNMAIFAWAQGWLLDKSELVA